MREPTSLTSDELLALVQAARWFGAKDKTPEGAEIVDVPVRDPVVTLAMAEVRFGTGTSTISAPSGVSVSYTHLTLPTNREV